MPHPFHTFSQSPSADGVERIAELPVAGPVNRAEIRVSGVLCTALLDTGSQVTTVTDEFVVKHPCLRQQLPRPTDVSIRGAGGQTVPHLGIIVVDVMVLGHQICKVLVFIVQSTPFRRDTPFLVGTNVIRASRDKMKSTYGRKFMMKSHELSQPWFQAVTVRQRRWR